VVTAEGVALELEVVGAEAVAALVLAVVAVVAAAGEVLAVVVLAVLVVVLRTDADSAGSCPEAICTPMTPPIARNVVTAAAATERLILCLRRCNAARRCRTSARAFIRLGCSCWSSGNL
jgi:hypothetical protein